MTTDSDDDIPPGIDLTNTAWLFDTMPLRHYNDYKIWRLCGVSERDPRVVGTTPAARARALADLLYPPDYPPDDPRAPGWTYELRCWAGHERSRLRAYADLLERNPTNRLNAEDESA
jgi:hypothetical protein